MITQSLATLRFSLANLIQSLTSIGERPIDKASAVTMIAALREAKVTEPPETETIFIVSLKEAESHLLKIPGAKHPVSWRVAILKYLDEACGERTVRV